MEGSKSVLELLHSDFEIVWVGATSGFLQQAESVLRNKKAEVSEASEAELEAAGRYQTNTSALAIARMKPNTAFPINNNEWVLVLDDIRDPGNLGTIIRTADWYGVNHIIASEETADFYNPKVISATMGSFCRVNVFYTSLLPYLQAARMPVYGTFLEGTDVHQLHWSGGGLLVIGNEANGISPAIEKLVTQKITIPRYGRAESLNAALATGIVLDVIRSKK